MNERYRGLMDAYLLVKGLRTYDYDASDNFLKRTQDYLQKEQQWVFESLTKPPKVDYNELARQEWLAVKEKNRKRAYRDGFMFAVVMLAIYLFWLWRTW